MQTKSTIIEYYDTCESDYIKFWDLDHSLAMHFGFWDKKTKTLSQALTRENEVLGEYAKIQKEDRILDVGCGIGGSSLFLAKHYGCQVTGITLSDRQVKKAKSYAKKHRLESLVKFEAMDFCHTTFPDASFDVIWGIESICHAENKMEFVQEAYRVLKPGGRLIMADGFGKKNYSHVELCEMRKWINGWGVESLESQEVFCNDLTLCGFSEIIYRNVTSNIMPSSKYMYWMSFPLMVYSKAGEWLGFRKRIQTNNVRAGYYQHTTLKKGLWEYGILSASKK